MAVNKVANSKRKAISLRRHAAETEARRYAWLYRRDRNGLWIWRAYQAFRSEGLAPPDEVLAKLDQFATRILKANSDAQVAEALELKNMRKGGPGAQARMKASEQSLSIVEEIAMYRSHGHATSNAEAYRRAAARRVPDCEGDDKAAREEREKRRASLIKTFESIYRAWKRRRLA